MNNSSIITIEDVSKSYHDGKSELHVLSHISTDFEQGKFISIQGRSGSGKSTLLNLIAGIDQADSGNIQIMGRDITGMSDDQQTLFRRKHIGFVFQSFNLIPTLRIDENLAFPLALNNMSSTEIKEKVSELLEDFSLADKFKSYPDQLSGGEQQRVAIARAIIHQPALILADEPTGNLDLETERQILEILKSLPEKYGVTIICATHSVDVANLSDHVFDLTDGILVPREQQNNNG